MKKYTKILFATLWVSVMSLAPSYARETTDNKKDTLESKTKNSALFLNAESDSKPREISLGLPVNRFSAVPIFEDGMPVSYYIFNLLPFKSWHGGASAISNGKMNPMETAMRFCGIGTYVDSYNRLGQDRFGGIVSYTLGSFGQNKIDINLSGPIARGWQYSVSTFQNYDPGSNAPVLPTLHDRHQFYKGVLSKAFNDGNGMMSLVYQYVNYVTLMDNYGPFIFVGDGSVKPYNGFSLGTDCYIPNISVFPYMDMKTGKMKEHMYRDIDKTHHLTFLLDRNLPGDIHLDVRSRFKTGISSRGSGTLAGIESVGPDSGFTYADGKAFSGILQKRIIMQFEAFETSWMNNAEIQFRKGSHSVRAGVDYMFNHSGDNQSSALLAHQVCADPEVLYRNGSVTFNYNTSADYYDGFEHKAAVYIKDDWRIGNNVSLAGFVRGEFHNIHGEAANNIGGDTSNTRYPGFNLTLGKITHFRENFFNWAAGIDVNVKIYGGLSFKANGVVTRIHTNINNYGGYYYPSTDPTDTWFAQAGLSYVNKWINVVSQLVFISQSNYNTRANFQHALQKPVGDLPVGYIETMSMALNYGIRSLGWTTDAIIHPFKGFDLHLNVLLRNPQYKDFVFKPTFSDGVTEEYDFSGNNVTSLNKFEFSMDPSYTFGKWTFWLTARYLSKQYVNKTNSLYFKGRWETFGGIDFAVNRFLKLNLNVINILNQKGASGDIGPADLITDTSEYQNYVMSGTFIRPFTVELGVNVKF